VKREKWSNAFCFDWIVCSKRIDPVCGAAESKKKNSLQVIDAGGRVKQFFKGVKKTIDRPFRIHYYLNCKFGMINFFYGGGDTP
jgi:hypothetical protein